jgi:Cu(I)/Ag(I) efflux system membrane fusion protein
MKPVMLAVVVLAVLGAGIWIGRGSVETTGTSGGAGEPPRGERKILYYRNPMGLPDTSPVPKQDNMGMDYIPVYEDEQVAAGLVKIAADKVQKIGVRTEAAARRVVQTEVHAVGVIEADERRVATVAPRFEGWIETLFVAETGRSIRRGEPLFTVYSPELVAAQQEYLLAREAERTQPGTLGEELLRSARARLGNWQIDAADIRVLEEKGEPQRALTFRSPVDGEVLEKSAVAGMRFMPGEVLYRIADLGTLWLMASVYEQDLADVELGQAVVLYVDAFPAEEFSGKVGFVYPTLDTVTRTARVRIELANDDRRLRPGMFGRVATQSSSRAQSVLAVPDSALLDSGRRQLVLVQLGEGLFAPRDVVVGRRGEDYVEIREGLAEGEQVVVSANFLIDAESNLKAALEGFGQGTDTASPVPPAAEHTHAGHGGEATQDAREGHAGEAMQEAHEGHAGDAADRAREEH